MPKKKEPEYIIVEFKGIPPPDNKAIFRLYNIEDIPPDPKDILIEAGFKHITK